MLNRAIGPTIALLGLAAATASHARSDVCDWGCGTNAKAETSIALDRVSLQTLCIHPGQVDLPPAK